MAYYPLHGTNPAQKHPLSIGSPTQVERRRATRHHFVSAVEVINVESRKQLISLTRDLSRCGCFVTVKAPSPKGTRVSLNAASKNSTRCISRSARMVAILVELDKSETKLEWALALVHGATALRPEECFALKWCDVDYANNQILVRRAWSKGKQSKSAERTPNLRPGAGFGLNLGLEKNRPNM